MAPTAPAMTGSETEPGMTIDQLATAAGTTTRRVRSLQTLGLLAHPELRGRTGLYGPEHRERLGAIVRLQDQGFSLESLSVLFGALDAGRSLAEVLGVGRLTRETTLVVGNAGGGAGTDTAELYGFADLQPPRATRHRAGRPLLFLVPTTLWEEGKAS